MITFLIPNYETRLARVANLLILYNCNLASKFSRNELESQSPSRLCTLYYSELSKLMAANFVGLAYYL